jgi:hypothetical protein
MHVMFMLAGRRLCVRLTICRSAANAERAPRAYHGREEVRAQAAPSRHQTTLMREALAFGRCNGGLGSRSRLGADRQNPMLDTPNLQLFLHRQTPDLGKCRSGLRSDTRLRKTAFERHSRQGRPYRDQMQEPQRTNQREVLPCNRSIRK